MHGSSVPHLIPPQPQPQQGAVGLEGLREGPRSLHPNLVATQAKPEQGLICLQSCSNALGPSRPYLVLPERETLQLEIELETLSEEVGTPVREAVAAELEADKSSIATESCRQLAGLATHTILNPTICNGLHTVIPEAAAIQQEMLQHLVAVQHAGKTLRPQLADLKRYPDTVQRQHKGERPTESLLERQSLRMLQVRAELQRTLARSWTLAGDRSHLCRLTLCTTLREQRVRPAHFFPERPTCSVAGPQ